MLRLVFRQVEFKQFKLLKQLSLNSVIDSHPRNRNLQDNLCNLFWEFNYFIGLNKKEPQSRILPPLLGATLQTDYFPFFMYVSIGL